jgi:putative methionine-R-sulfoxide reductase with GAF domain
VQTALESIVRNFSADTGTIHVLEGSVLALAAHVGLPPAVTQLVTKVPIGKGMAGLAAQRDEAVRTCNIQTDQTGDVRPGARQTGVGGAIVVPIRGPNGAVLGTLGIGVQRPHDYDEQETARLFQAALELGRKMSEMRDVP